MLRLHLSGWEVSTVRWQQRRPVVPNRSIAKAVPVDGPCHWKKKNHRPFGSANKQSLLTNGHMISFKSNPGRLQSVQVIWVRWPTMCGMLVTVPSLMTDEINSFCTHDMRCCGSGSLGVGEGGNSNGYNGVCPTSVGWSHKPHAFAAALRFV